MTMVSTEQCEQFIKNLFKENNYKEINVTGFWREAELSGLWVRGTFDSPMTSAVLKLLKVKYYYAPNPKDDTCVFLPTFRQIA